MYNHQFIRQPRTNIAGGPPWLVLSRDNYDLTSVMNGPY